MDVSQHQPPPGEPTDGERTAPAAVASGPEIAGPPVAGPEPAGRPAATPAETQPVRTGPEPTAPPAAGAGVAVPAGPAEVAPGAGDAGRGSLFVPVRRGPAGVVLRLWRTPFGTRTAVAFTSDQRLRSVLGPCQPWIRLSEAALRRMAEPLGAPRLTVDPLLTARPPTSWSDAAAGRPCGTAVKPSQEPAGTAP